MAKAGPLLRTAARTGAEAEEALLLNPWRPGEASSRAALSAAMRAAAVGVGAGAEEGAVVAAEEGAAAWSEENFDSKF